MKNLRSKGMFLSILFILVSLNLSLYLDGVGTEYPKIGSSAINSDVNNWIAPQGIESMLDGNISGSGISQQVNFSCNVQGSYIDFSSGEHLELSLGEWELERINISVNNLIAYNSTMGEDGMDDKLDLFRPAENEYYVMPFTIPYAYCYLTNITVYFNIKRLQAGNDVSLVILNAQNLLGAPAPNSQIFAQDYDLGDVSMTGWVDFSMSQLLTNVSTAFYTYYIGFQELAANVDIEWLGQQDSKDPEGDEFNVYYWDGTWNSDEDMDLTLISESYFSPIPSDIALKINGTSVNDIALGQGYLNLIYEPPLAGNLYYEFEATQFFSVDINYVEELEKMALSESHFIADSAWDYTKWNSSAEVVYPNESSEETIQWELPNWNVEQIRKDGVPLDPSNWDVTGLNGQVLVTINTASTGYWILECNSTNFISNVDVWRSGMLVDTVNGTDIITGSANFTHRLATGYSNLTILPFEAASFEDSKQLTVSTESVQFSSWNISATAKTNPGVFSVQVTWFNGTEVGINSTILNVLDIPTNITYISHTNFRASGQSVFVYLNYSNYFTSDPIPNAEVLVKNSTNNEEWPNPYLITRYFSNGTYEIEVITLGLDTGVHHLSINMSKPLYSSAELIYINFTIGGGTSDISINEPKCFGLTSINQTTVIADPPPYHNSTVKVGIFYFANDTGEPLRNAIITPTWLGGGPSVAWIPAFFGYYNITIDVTGFRSNTNHTLRIKIQEEGYEAAELDIIVPVRKLPTTIEPFETLYEKYLEESFIIYAVYKDTFNDRSIPAVYDLNGNFTIRVGSFTDNMTLLAPGLGIYYYDISLQTLNLQEGNTYNVTFFAFSSEHQFASIIISLYIIPKAEIGLEILDVPSYVLAGEQFKIYANLSIKNSAPIVNTPITFRIISNLGQTQSIQLTNLSGIAQFMVETNPVMETIQIITEYNGNTTVQNGTVVSNIVEVVVLNSSLTISPLPTELMQGQVIDLNATLLINGTPAVDKIITFTFSYVGSDRVDIKTATTGSGGIASVSHKIPNGISRIYVQVSFQTLDYVQGNATSSETAVISTMTLVWRYSPYWLAMLGIIIGTAVTYKYGYKRPKLRRLRAQWEKSANKFIDAANLDFLMIILRESGASVYNYSFKGEQLDYALMGGFLTAISTFQGEIVRAEPKGTEQCALDWCEEEWEINYHNFKIYGITRDIAQFVLILENSPSEELKIALFNFGQEIEKQYSEKLKNYTGNVQIFKPIDSIVRGFFEINLILPNISREITRDQMKKLSDLERKMYNLGGSFSKERGYFFASNLFESASAILKEESNHILDVIYSLMAKHYFIAVTPEELDAHKHELKRSDEKSIKTPKELKKELQKMLETAETAEKKNYISLAIDNYQKAIPMLRELKLDDRLEAVLKRIEELKQKNNNDE